MQTRTFALLLITLFLSACATSRAPVEKHATDLELVRLGVEALLPRREVAGDVKRIEDAADGGQAFTFGMDAEETIWLQQQDQARAVDFVRKATAAIAESRQPTCAWWAFRCRSARRAALAPFEKTAAP